MPVTVRCDAIASMERREFLGLLAASPLLRQSLGNGTNDGVGVDAGVVRVESERIGPASAYIWPLMFGGVGGQPITFIEGAVDVVSRSSAGAFFGSTLVLPPAVAERFDVIDIKVGNRSQLANSTSVPGELFQLREVGVDLALDMVTCGQDVALVVENTVDGSALFNAAIFGTASREVVGQRQFPLGFHHGRVAPGCRHAVITRPQIPFEPTRLFVPRRMLDKFAIRAVSVSTSNDCLLAGGKRTRPWSLSLETCTVERSPNGHASWTWSRDTIDGQFANSGDDIAIVVDNLTSTPQAFRAAMVGYAVSTPEEEAILRKPRHLHYPVR